ncbi:MAG: hypothetical protein KAS21_07220 [Candidatus Aminicenantes bacterium]|nr:hypothetical protein [Candidatus Aminicenantes bacterium]
MERIFSTIIIIFILVCQSVNGIVISKSKFRLRNLASAVWVELDVGRSDIMIDTESVKNLSSSFSGENLFPKTFVNRDEVFVTWINYRGGDSRMIFYNSLLDNSEIVIDDKFSFISKETEIIFSGVEPRVIIFRGIKNSNNEDLFLYDLFRKKMRRITFTDMNEKTIKIKNIHLSEDSSFYLETETINNSFLYIVSLDDFNVRLLEKKKNAYLKKRTQRTATSDSLKYLIGFGDSITWGKIRMNDLEDSYHPELTYWSRVAEFLSDNFRKTEGVNLGVNKDSSYKGLLRMREDFEGINAYICLIMFGTNDVVNGSFSCSSTCENIKQIYEIAKNEFGLLPVYITIPPQKQYLSGIQFFKEKTEELNKSLTTMSKREKLLCVDIYGDFMNYYLGWEVLLEDVKGNHPSPAGHRVIADRIISLLAEIYPLKVFDLREKIIH